MFEISVLSFHISEHLIKITRLIFKTMKFKIILKINEYIIQLYKLRYFKYCPGYFKFKTTYCKYKLNCFKYDYDKVYSKERIYIHQI